MEEEISKLGVENKANVIQADRRDYKVSENPFMNRILGSTKIDTPTAPLRIMSALFYKKPRSVKPTKVSFLNFIEKTAITVVGVAITVATFVYLVTTPVSMPTAVLIGIAGILGWAAARKFFTYR